MLSNWAWLSVPVGSGLPTWLQSVTGTAAPPTDSYTVPSPPAILKKSPLAIG